MGPLSWKHPCRTDQILKVILYLVFNMRVLSLTRVFLLAAMVVLASPAPFLDPATVTLGSAAGLVLTDAAGVAFLTLPSWYLLKKALLAKGLVLTGGLGGGFAGAGIGARVAGNANANANAGAGFGGQYGGRYNN